MLTANFGGAKIYFYIYAFTPSVEAVIVPHNKKYFFWAPDQTYDFEKFFFNSKIGQREKKLHLWPPLNFRDNGFKNFFFGPFWQTFLMANFGRANF